MRVWGFARGGGQGSRVSLNMRPHLQVMHSLPKCPDNRGQSLSMPFEFEKLM